jgi:glyoxylase-like metal-dependent hydrolase (beta-lactamase superfamily II)
MPSRSRETPGNRIEVARIVVGPFQENCFLLRAAGGPECVVIDPGDEADRIADRIDASGWKPVAIVNTHAHLDHIGGIQELKEKYGIPLFLHAADEPLLGSAHTHARFFGVAEPSVPAVDRRLADGDVLDFGGIRLEVLHTPGHSPGSVSLVAGGRVFVGDTLFEGSIGRTDLPGGSHETLLRSIRGRLFALPDEVIAHCGHGPDTTIGRERRSNPFLRESSKETIE